jgi:hypothetical protein
MLKHMVKIGDSMKCPECANMGHIVWVSKNGKTVGVQCSESHNIGGRVDSYGFKRAASKVNKNSVFLVKTELV